MQKFRNFRKELNLLIGTVHIELIQLDRIMTIMRTNSPAPMKLAKMYEEITTITIEVTPYSLPSQYFFLLTYSNWSEPPINKNIKFLAFVSFTTHSYAFNTFLSLTSNLLLYRTRRLTAQWTMTEPTSSIPPMWDSPRTQVELVSHT